MEPKEIIFVSKTHKYLLVLETKKRQKEDGVAMSGKHIEFHNFVHKTSDIELVERLKKVPGFGVNFWIMDKDEVAKLKLEDKTMKIGVAGMDSDSESNSRLTSVENKIGEISNILNLIVKKLGVDEAPVEEVPEETVPVEEVKSEEVPEEEYKNAPAEEEDDKKK